MPEPIHITGLKEFNRALKNVDPSLPKTVRLALNDASNLIVDKAVPKVPRRSGRAARTLKAKSTRTEARVSGGGNRAPYYPWLDFGGSVGKDRSVKRAFLKDGRYLYATYFENRDQVREILSDSLTQLAKDSGLVIQ